MDRSAARQWKVQVVGDDLLVTDPQRIRAAAKEQLAAAALIKPNQVGTVTKTLEALAAAREVGWGAMVSHRSGETTDTFIADLAAAAGELKTGAPARARGSPRTTGCWRSRRPRACSHIGELRRS